VFRAVGTIHNAKPESYTTRRNDGPRLISYCESCGLDRAVTTIAVPKTYTTTDLYDGLEHSKYKVKMVLTGSYSRGAPFFSGISNAVARMSMR